MNRHKQAGVTLMELLVVMVVVGILTAIAYPSYRQQVIRTNRADAKTALTQRAQQLERCFTRGSTFVGCLALPETTPAGTYQISFAAGMPTQTLYQLVATPLAGQLDDAQCGVFTLNQTNARTASGTSTDEDCWRR